ncbi:MAG: tetratricopeptide repeat protein [Candidatus Magnetoovum sp. WYHC-5]|nr:tetratricopeptide repeat protein [Candidatus Magnetoovum sp. WYHC-5]
MLEDFKSLIASHIGVYLHNQDRVTLEKTLTERMRALGIDEPGYYYMLLKSNTCGVDNEWKQLIIHLTTGESYFFRDAGQFDIIRKIIIPELINIKQAEKSLRIWSAGCSTGEEPYSIAILINELRQLIPGWSVSIIGTDINEEALCKAQRGIYGQWSFRSINEDIKCKYFISSGGKWQLDNNICKMVRFDNLNLIKDDLPNVLKGIYSIDLIICRNVFIYFDRTTVALILKKFRETLLQGGFLVVGHAELYGQDLNGLFTSKAYPESTIYRKSDGIIVTTEENRHIKNPVAPVINVRVKIKKETLPTQPTQNLQELISIAKSYADMGKYAEASEICQKLVEKHPLTVLPYYLLAQISVQHADNERAKALYQKVIYLDSAYIAAYVELSYIYENEGNSQKAKRMRIIATELLGSLTPDTTIEPYEYTAGELLQFMKNIGI